MDRDSSNAIEGKVCTVKISEFYFQKKIAKIHIFVRNFTLKHKSLYVANFLTPRGPCAESVIHPVEAFSQPVSSSPFFFCRCSVSRTRLDHSFISQQT